MLFGKRDHALANQCKFTGSHYALDAGAAVEVFAFFDPAEDYTKTEKKPVVRAGGGCVCVCAFVSRLILSVKNTTTKISLQKGSKIFQKYLRLQK